ncbi:cytochrome c oxidase subunit 3 family protein [Thiobacillus sp. 65-1402]|uniref:Putative denitrification protein NorE n=2 Tax=Thiobacillus denitrificans TaxID=36861 RepID=Q3SHG3_THIDA|nr:cytochrome c oxidase subunit 3 family protein [Thiobacillus sp. 65-1402]AAZ97923.1 putative denitrification protein NorE [Thiobacillus denitrificans ATCC 25259]OJW55249.1 MAG: cytochrome C oxidase subunit III [Thiobacillus sp. 65-1059]OJW97920.1 MAG: cytochrome C oxidase subunit III [Thiobacillus sp. 65-1402]OZA21959.1 MAG: cytochrome C oxidase subunit III [Hydrogenophilales bacterium 17-64-11]
MTTLAIEAPSRPQVRTVTGRIPGNRGMWAGITCEFVEFIVLFAVYFVARAHFPDAFEQGAQRLSLASGTAITLIMVTSSFFIACSVATIRAGRRRQSFWWLVAGLVVALGYPVVKFFEVQANLAQGINGEAGIFFTVYYYLTINHLVHSFWGILGIFWVLARHLGGAYSSDDYSGLEALASYWHATDIIWLVIFQLCYVLA